MAEFERDLIRARTSEGSRPREGARSEPRPAAQAHAPSAAGSPAAQRGWGVGSRNRPQLCREPQHDCTAQRMSR